MESRLVCDIFCFQGVNRMDESFEMYRSERRSFFCPNKLWKQLEKETDGVMSISQFIRIAIEDKLEK